MSDSFFTKEHLQSYFQQVIEELSEDNAKYRDQMFNPDSFYYDVYVTSFNPHLLAYYTEDGLSWDDDDCFQLTPQEIEMIEEVLLDASQNEQMGQYNDIDICDGITISYVYRGEND